MNGLTMSTSDRVSSVSNDASPPNSTSTFRFLSLPTEIRLEIYNVISENAVIFLGRQELKDKSFSMIGTLKQICSRQSALALTSKSILNEALPILARHTQVVINDEMASECRQDLLANLPAGFMCHVQNIKVPQEHFIRTDRSRLPNLKSLILADSIAVCRTLQGFHRTTCPYPGDELKNDQVYQNLLSMWWDWTWKRKQLLHLAREGEYGIQIILFIYCQKPNLRFEWQYDLATEKIVHKRLIKGLEVLKEYEDLETDDTCAALSELYKEPWADIYWALYERDWAADQLLSPY